MSEDIITDFVESLPKEYGNGFVLMIWSLITILIGTWIIAIISMIHGN